MFMGILSFIIGFFVGGAFLSGPVSQIASKFVPIEIGGVCLVKVPFLPWCFFGAGYIGLITGLVVGIIFYMLFK